jgi:hypothetical protein
LSGHRHTDANLIAAFNDRKTFPTIAGILAHTGYTERHFYARMQKIRGEHPDGTLIDRKEAYDTAQRRGERLKERRAGNVAVVGDPKVQRWLLTAAQDETPIDEQFFAQPARLRRAHRRRSPGGRLHLQQVAVRGSRVADGRVRERRAALHGSRQSDARAAAVRGQDEHPADGREAAVRSRELRPRRMDGVPARQGAAAIGAVAARPGIRDGDDHGACTVPNYIEKKAGLKAEFHHQIGATIVELDSAGRLFCRQIGAATDGSFQDLDAVVRAGQVTFGHRVEASPGATSTASRSTRRSLGLAGVRPTTAPSKRTAA